MGRAQGSVGTLAAKARPQAAWPCPGLRDLPCEPHRSPVQLWPLLALGGLSSTRVHGTVCPDIRTPRSSTGAPRSSRSCSTQRWEPCVSWSLGWRGILRWGHLWPSRGQAGLCPDSGQSEKRKLCFRWLQGHLVHALTCHPDWPPRQHVSPIVLLPEGPSTV